MSKLKRTETIYSSAVVQALEQQYCSSCSAAVVSPCSSMGLGERVVSRIYNGGRKALYTAAVGAMLVNNGLPIYGATITVSSGVTSSNLSAGEGTQINVYGKTISTTVMASGREYVYDGGSANETTINSSGQQIISSGGYASGTKIQGFDYYSGILGRASQTIYSGGSADDTAVYSGGTQYISGGVANSTIISSGGTQRIYRGGQANNDVVTSNGTVFISSGGIANSTVLSQGGSQTISSAGIANSTIVNSGGHLVILSSGMANDTIVHAGGLQYLSSGGKAYDIVQNSGGGIAAYVYGGDNQTYLSGTNQEGETMLLQNGIASNFILNSGGYLRTYSGGIVSNTIINSGGWLRIYPGAKAYGVIQNAGHVNLTVIGEDTETYISGINQNGDTMLLENGVADNFILNTSGEQIVMDGGVANHTIVNSIGWQTVLQDGIANNTTINSGGSQVVSFGGIANSTMLHAGGSQIISSGGVANDTLISSAGSQFIEKGGTANRTTIKEGGEQYVHSSGMANSTVIEAGGSQIIADGGIVDGAVIYNSGTQEVSSGGVISSSIINSGGTIVVEDGGTTIDVVINNGGTENISSGGMASGTTINSGGIQTISEGGSTTNTTINTGGIQNVQGVASDTMILAGTQNVLSGGHVDNTQLNGGTQHLSSGGLATNTTLNSGTINLYVGGTTSGLNATGGALNVYGDNTLQGNITLANAHINIQHDDGMNTLGIQNLAANNAVFNMNVDLVEQTGDKLSITDTYTGNANLQLTNVAAGAKETTENGIKLVEFGSAATVNGTFDLVGGQWDEGGYIYKLQQGTQAGEGSDYYLRSTGVLTDTFKTMLNVPVMNAMIAQTGMNSLQRRLGDLRAMNNPDAKQGVWVRSYYKDMTVKDLAKTDLNLFGAEAGYDWLFRADEPTKLYAGVLVGFVSANSIKTENNQGMYDKGDGEAPGVGVYATLINESGWFVDIAARNFWSKLDMKNHASDGTELAYKPKRNVFAASVEAGKSFNTDLARNRFIRIEPKVEVGYMNAASSTTDVANTGNQIKYDAANYINAKAGVLLSYNAIRSNGLLIEPLLELAYRYEFDGKGNVSYGGAKTESNLRGGAAEINAGLNMQLTDHLYWYGLGSYEASDKVKGWGVHAGIRYAFGGKKIAKSKKVKQANKPAKLTQIEKPNVIQEERTVPEIPVQVPEEPTLLHAEPMTPAPIEPIVEQPQVQRPAMVSFDEEVPREIANGQVKPLERSMMSKDANK